MKHHPLVAVGGTFDLLQKGHESIILEAFQYGDLVVIGIISDEYAKKMGKYCTQSFQERSQAVRELLTRNALINRAMLVPLNDPYGPLIEDDDIEGVIVTEDTLSTAGESNKLRISRGLNPVKIYVVRLKIAKDGLPISSTRIRNKEIDKYGNPITF